MPTQGHLATEAWDPPWPPALAPGLCSLLPPPRQAAATGRIPSRRALALRGQAACGGRQGSRGREAGPAAVLETCLPQNSQIFKNNSGGFCLAFALKDFFSFCTELCSSGKGQPALAAEWSRVEPSGQGWHGEGRVQGGQGSAPAPGSRPGWLCGPGNQDQVGDRWGELSACLPVTPAWARAPV